MRHLYFIIFLIFTIFSGSKLLCQSTSSPTEDADRFFVKGSFANALPVYLELISRDSTNPFLNMRAGECYLNSRSQKEKAFRYLKKAVTFYDRSETNSPSDVARKIRTYELLGDASLMSGDYPEAYSHYQKSRDIFLKYNISDCSIFYMLSWKIQICFIAGSLKRVSPPLIARNLKIAGISQKLAPSPLITLNKEHVSTFCKASLSRRSLPENIYYQASTEKPVLDTSQPRVYADSIHNPLGEEATIATSMNGQLILIYRDEGGDAVLRTSRLLNNHWTSEERMNNPSNETGWEQHEIISADGKLLFFVSERPEGMGGKDIYMCKRMPSGTWGPAINLGPKINSAYDEQAPFISTEGRTLYFSSNRYKYGNHFELFSSTMSLEGIWSAPVHIGYPVTKDSVLLLLREQPDNIKDHNGFQESITCKITFKDQNMLPITVLKGTVKDFYGNVPENIRIIVADNERKEICSVILPDKRTGAYCFILPSLNNCNISFEADHCLFYSENRNAKTDTSMYEIYQQVVLAPLHPGSATILRNVFFDSLNAALLSLSEIELVRLTNFLSIHPALTVELSSPDSYNAIRHEHSEIKRLRVQSVKNYLTDNGISDNRIVINYRRRSDKKSRTGKTHKDAIKKTGFIPGVQLKILS